jgi:hypothetical protein
MDQVNPRSTLIALGRMGHQLGYPEQPTCILTSISVRRQADHLVSLPAQRVVGHPQGLSVVFEIL